MVEILMDALFVVWLVTVFAYAGLFIYGEWLKWRLRKMEKQHGEFTTWHCALCGSSKQLQGIVVILTHYKHGQGTMHGYYAPLCADCHTIAPTGASPERAK